MRLAAVAGNPLVGMYAKVSEEFAVVGVRDDSFAEAIREELGVEVIKTTVAGSELVGALAAANSNGVVVSNHVTRKEVERLSKVFDVHIVDTQMTCLGNILCLNDKGAIAHPEIENALMDKVAEVLDVDIARGTIGGIKTVGMAATVTAKGGLLNPNANDWEIKKVKDVLKIDVVTGTVNFGSDMVGTGLVANSKGYIAGEDTTGFELGVIEEALGFL
jgi:translation initiation factor 6